jgi:hypothetical protein
MKLAVRLQPTDLWRIAAASRGRRLKTSSRARAAISIARRAIRTGESGCDVVVGLFFNPVVRERIKRRSATHDNFDAGIRGLKATRLTVGRPLRGPSNRPNSRADRGLRYFQKRRTTLRNGRGPDLFIVFG